MPSRRHEELLRLFQNRPALAAEVASEILHERLPEFSAAHIPVRGARTAVIGSPVPHRAVGS